MAKKEKESKKKADEKKAKQVELNAVEDKMPEISADEPNEEQLQFARINMRKHFNSKFSKWATIEPDDADDDFIAQTKKDLEEAVEIQKHADYEIATAEDGLALKSAEFLKTWNENFNSWEKGMWRGLIRFNIVIDGLIKDLRENPEKSLIIDYQTLIFLYNSMMTPSGIGLESARRMAKFENYNEETDGPYEENIPVTYSGILSKIKDHINYLSAVDKKLNVLRQRVQLAYAGLKMTIKVTELEEFVEFHDAITSTGVEDATEEVIPDNK